jgi:MFS family permease
MGRAGDLYGRRRLSLGGLALAPWMLVAARLLQGVGGAALVPASLALVAASFAEGEERNRAMGVHGAMDGVGFVFGMVLGGVITEFLGWRWVLFVNVPVALAVLSLAPVAIHESKNGAAPRMLDLAGAATVTLGLASLIYAVSEAPKNGWASPATLGTPGWERSSLARSWPPSAGRRFRSSVGAPWTFQMLRSSSNLWAAPPSSTC